MSQPGPYGAISFDCYGTLIDWQRGLSEAVQRETGLGAGAILEQFLAAREREEWRLLTELDDFRPYRELLAASLQAAAPSAGVSLDDRAAARVAASIGEWPAFEDATAALSRLAARFPLALVSNVDRVDLARTIERLGVKITHAVAADDVTSYKPEPDHLLALLHEMVLDEHELLHVSSYAHYDLMTAQDLGIPAAYVNRYDEPLGEDVEVAIVVGDLTALADQLLARPRRRPPHRYR
ncbi:MAG: HAD hydrolase-like protein [Acidobacteriota bacterium]|nr:MAG: HAD hydrolase-like protein [Acidobacteriota bacterium]